MEFWEWGIIFANMLLMTANIALLRKRINKKAKRRPRIQPQAPAPFGLEQILGGR